MGLREALNTAYKGALTTGGDTQWHTDFLPTGIIPVDIALGGGRIGGFAYGRASEIAGEYSTGKTMILYYALANNQRLGGISALIEQEGAYNAEFYSMLGGDPDSLILLPREEVRTVEGTFDHILKIAKVMVKNRDKDDTPLAIGWDGIAATATKHLLEAGMDKRDMSKANAMSVGCAMISDDLAKARIALIATNQLREKIGDNSSEPHTPGGKGYPYLCSQRILLENDGGWKGSAIFDKNNADNQIGRWVRGQVFKNKCASPFKKFSVPIYTEAGMWHPVYPYGTKIGICIEEAMFYMYLRSRFLPASKVPIITSGASGWYTLSEEFFPGHKKFQQGDWPEVYNEHESLRTAKFE